MSREHPRNFGSITVTLMLVDVAPHDDPDDDYAEIVVKDVKVKSVDMITDHVETALDGGGVELDVPFKRFEASIADAEDLVLAVLRKELRKRKKKS